MKRGLVFIWRLLAPNPPYETGVGFHMAIVGDGVGHIGDVVVGGGVGEVVVGLLVGTFRWQILLALP